MSFANATKPQYQLVREHLTAGKSITPGHAMLVYGISRLAVAIDKLRSDGMDIDMILRTDEAGKRYGEYKLAAAGSVRIGSRVQVRKGHGWGLPGWVRTTELSKVVGMVQDVAYVQFGHRNGTTQVFPLNLKELIHVA